MSQVRRILLVEDDEVLRRSTARLLCTRGYSVKVASSRAEARTAFRADEVDCVLLDFFLGDGTGDQVVADIRARDARVPILVVTGHAATRSLEELERELAIQGVHDKGDGPVALLRRIEHVLPPRASWEAVGA